MSIDGGLRREFRKHIPQFFWQSIETGGTGLGIPDSNFCSPDGVEGWVEYKQTDGYAVTLLPEQVGWLSRRARYRGRVWIAVRRVHQGGPRRGPSVDELYVLPGALAVAAKMSGLRGPLVARKAKVWAGGPSKWDWEAVARLLVK